MTVFGSVKKLVRMHKNEFKKENISNASTGKYFAALKWLAEVGR